MESLSKKTCVPCQTGTPPLKGEKLSPFLKEIDAKWKVVDEHHLEREYHFPDFKKAFAFVQKIADLAEEQQHHPDIYLAWGKVSIKTWTHKINGLSENDFILAAKCDQLT